MTMTEYAPKTDAGMYAYVVTINHWGRPTERIEMAATLVDAKSKHGWTRAAYTTIKVRRATIDDVARLKR